MRAKPQIGVLLLAVELVAALLLLFAAPAPAAAQFFDFFGGGGRGRQPSFIPFFDQPRARPRVQARPVAPGGPAQQSDFSRAPTQTPPKAGSPDAKSVVVLGDSMADWLANGLEQAYADAPEVAVVRNTRPGSSLIFNPGRHDPRTSVDWPVAAREMLGNEPASFIVMMTGLGDRDPIRVLPPRPKPAPKPDTASPGEQQAKPAEAPDSTDQATADQGAPDPKAVPISYEFKSEKWAELYGKRIDEMIAVLKSKGVPVFWVGLPPVFGPRSMADMQYLNDLFRKHAEKAGITYIDVWDGFIDEQGRFALQGPDYEGQIRRLRTPDGIFFTPAGARKLAHYVEREIQRALTPTGPIAVRLPEEPLLLQQQSPAAAPGSAPAPAPSAGTPRPLAGPVIPLNASVEPSKTAALLGSAAPQQSIADADYLSTAAQSCSARGSSPSHLSDQQAAGSRQFQCLRPIARDQVCRNADGARGGPLSGFEIAQHRFGAVDGHGETDADAPAVGAVDGGVESDHVALRIEQRTAAVARIDRRVGLDHIVQIAAVLPLDFAMQRAHDAGGQGSRQAEWIADRQHLLPDLKAVGIAQLEERGQLLFGIDLDQRKIVTLVAHQNPGAVAALIRGYGHLHVGAAANHVIIGENLAVGINDESRPQPLYRLHAEEKIALVGGAGDVHHAFLGGLIDFDVIHLIGAEAGGLRHGGTEPYRPGRRQEGAKRRILAAGEIHEDTHQRGGDQECSKPHGSTLRNASYTVRTC